MSSIAKGIGVGGVNTKGVALTVLVVLLVVGLFFIPEIIDFQKGIRGLRSSVKSSSTVAVKQSEEPIKSVVSSEPDIEKVVVPVASTKREGFFDRLMGYFRSDKGVTPAELRSANRDARENERTDVVQRQLKNFPVSGGESTTWKNIKSDESMASLRLAHDQSVALAKTLPAKYNDSIVALYAYASGVKFVMGSAEKDMSALKAYSFLEQLDSAVSSAMVREKVPSADYNTWARISLGPVFAKSAVLRAKINNQLPFNPALRVVSIKVIQPPDDKLEWVENNPAILHLVGAVEGRDVSKVEIYRNGEQLKDRTPRRPDRFGLRYFFIRGGDARGVYTFRVFDKGGQVYTKSYFFYNKARMFPWLPKRKGVFAIPVGDFDPKLDRMFTYRAGELRGHGNGAGGAHFFTTSIGTGIGTF